MRRAVLAALVAVAVMAWPADAQIIPVGPETTIIDGTQIFFPGGENVECVDLLSGQLHIEASSPPGRTGETAYLDVYRAMDSGAETYLHTLVTDVPVVALYTIEAGRYCYDLTVTHRLQDTGDPNRPERPSKQVNLTLKFAARAH